MQLHDINIGTPWIIYCVLISCHTLNGFSSSVFRALEVVFFLTFGSKPQHCSMSQKHVLHIPQDVLDKIVADLQQQGFSVQDDVLKEDHAQLIHGII